jgi:phage terminase large subunit GpA-like protein
MKVKLFDHPERLSVSEFAEKNVILQEGAAKGQKFSYKNRPYFKEPSDAMGDNRHNCRVVIMSPTQLGKTSAFLNYLFYVTTYDPDNTLIILDSNKSADKLAKVRIRPFLKTQVKLDSLQKGLHVDYDKSATTTNISLCADKNIIIGSARSASDLCSFSCKYLLCDETSRYPDCIDKEGDPITLALQRQETYINSMAILTSTPTTEECSINKHYIIGTQEEWCAICECGHYMPVKYDDIDFTDINKPTYMCPKCGQIYDEYTLQYKLIHAYAPPANKIPYTDRYGRICKSYHIPGTLVPERYSWKSLREKELASKQLGYGGYMSFVNTSLGEVYFPGIDECLDINKMLQYRHYYTKDRLPAWVQIVTCGIDTQDNRFELVVIGSDITRKHICFIERKVILGDLKESTVWEELFNYLNNFICTTRDNRNLRIHISCIDAGGHFTQDVYAFCLKSPRLRPIRGFNTQATNTDLIYKVTDVPLKVYTNGAGRVQVTLININYAKDIIHENLLSIQSDSKKSNWVITSDNEARFDSIFFDQMNSEFRETYKGNKVKWVCKNGVRNEALDCTAYALAAIDIARLMTGNAATSIQVENTSDNQNISDELNDTQDTQDTNNLTLTTLLSETTTSHENVIDKKVKLIRHKRKL